MIITTLNLHLEIQKQFDNLIMEFSASMIIPEMNAAQIQNLSMNLYFNWIP